MMNATRFSFPFIPDDMEIIDGMPASKPKSPAQVRAPWED